VAIIVRWGPPEAHNWPRPGAEANYGQREAPTIIPTEEDNYEAEANYTDPIYTKHLLRWVYNRRWAIIPVKTTPKGLKRAQNGLFRENPKNLYVVNLVAL